MYFVSTRGNAISHVVACDDVRKAGLYRKARLGTPSKAIGTQIFCGVHAEGQNTDRATLSTSPRTAPARPRGESGGTSASTSRHDLCTCTIVGTGRVKGDAEDGRR